MFHFRKWGIPYFTIVAFTFFSINLLFNNLVNGSIPVPLNVPSSSQINHKVVAKQINHSQTKIVKTPPQVRIHSDIVYEDKRNENNIITSETLMKKSIDVKQHEIQSSGIADTFYGASENENNLKRNQIKNWSRENRQIVKEKSTKPIEEEEEEEYLYDTPQIIPILESSGKIIDNEKVDKSAGIDDVDLARQIEEEFSYDAHQLLPILASKRKTTDNENTGVSNSNSNIDENRQISIFFHLLTLSHSTTQLIGKIAMLFSIITAALSQFWLSFLRKNNKQSAYNSFTTTSSLPLLNEQIVTGEKVERDPETKKSSNIQLSNTSMSFSSIFMAFTPTAIWNSYLSVLDAYPLMTKMITAAIIMGLADFVEQYIEIKLIPYSQDDESSASDDIKVRLYYSAMDDIDWKRVIRFALFGFLLQAPWTHFFFAKLDELFPPTPNPFSIVTLKKVLIDQLIGSPIFTLLIFIFLGVLEGKSFGTIKNQINNIYGETMIVNWLVFFPAVSINFAFVPPQLRTLFLNVVFFFWSIYLSFKVNRSDDPDENYVGPI